LDLSTAVERVRNQSTAVVAKGGEQ
jgi:hypothetical protein